MEILILLISVFVFLYVLHYYVRDDFIILRKNVSVEDIFNMAFFSFIFVFIFSRSFYVLGNPSPIFLNPLVFLAFPYYPGFSLTGGIFGGAVFLIWYVRRKKFPGKRMFDFFSVSALWGIAIYLLLSIIIFRKFSLDSLIEGISFAALLVIFSAVFLPKYLSGKIKDGFITGIFCISYSLVSIITVFLGRLNASNVLEVVLLGILFFSGLIFILKEELIPRIKDLK